MISGFKRKASEEATSPESGQQIIKKARTDSPVKEVRSSAELLRLFALTATTHRKMAYLKNLRSALFHSLRRYPPILRYCFSYLFMSNG